MEPASSNPTAAVLIIGNEILSGRTTDKNLHYIARKLFGIGIVLREVRVVPDDESEIIAAVNVLRERFRYVFTTGGIGSTHDDITIASIAKAFGVDVYEDPAARAALEAYYGEGHLNTARLRMAQIPKGAQLIPNKISSAPGVRMDNVFIMAGVPEIMQVMFDAAVADLGHGAPIYVKTVRCSVPESVMSDELRALATQYPDLDIGSYPSMKGGVLSLSLVVKGYDEAMATRAAEDIAAIVRTHGDTPQVADGF